MTFRGAEIPVLIFTMWTVCVESSVEQQSAICVVVWIQWGGVWLLEWTDDADEGQASQRLDVQWICTDIWTLPVCLGQ